MEKWQQATLQKKNLYSYSNTWGSTVKSLHSKITTPPLPKRTFTKNNARTVLSSNFEAALSIFYCMHEKSKKLIFSKLEIRALEQITQSSLLILYKQPILFCFPSL